jgi:hypothetical protein
MNDTPYQAVTELAAIHLNLAEYLGQLERELAAARAEVERHPIMNTTERTLNGGNP